MRKFIPLLILTLALLLGASAVYAQGGSAGWQNIENKLFVLGETRLYGGLTGPVTFNSEHITVTNATAFTPVGLIQPIGSSGTVTPTLGAGTAGQVTTLVNRTNTSIVLVDTGTQMLGGTRTLGQYDTLMLYFDGTNWIEISTTNN